MTIYKQMKYMGEILPLIRKMDDDQFIPFDISNNNYLNFKLDLVNGAELQDAEGNAMSSADIQTFLAGLK